MFTDSFSTVFFYYYSLLAGWARAFALVKTDATTQVLMTPRSSSVYPKQVVILEEPIPEWGSLIPEELGSRNDIFV